MTALPSLYNTLTRQVEPIVPVRAGEVGVYCCGPTVYDAPHAGHARSALAPDLLVRRLRSLGVKVKYVRNITDVDDKILERAARDGEEPLALSRRMATIYQEQIRASGCLAPDHEPRVSEHLPQICDIVTRLVEREAAYVVEMAPGVRDVYFAVRSFPGYGKLSRRKLDELVAGARVETNAHKRDPLDFALWKGAPAGEWGWESPWGLGRPGWHIECSAMCTHYLGQPFDVHTGGMDLIFPHHENEIAQSEAAFPDHTPLARIWMHNGFLNVDKEKMSKSLGNFVTVSDVFERNDPEALRMFFLSAHYRGPIQFDTEQLADGRVVFPGVDEAERRVDHAYSALRRLGGMVDPGLTMPAKLGPELLGYRDASNRALREAEGALDDDLNTPVALAALGELTRMGHELADTATKKKKDAAFVAAAGAGAQFLLSAMYRIAGQLGLFQCEPEAYAARTRARRLRLRGLTAEAIDAKLLERTAARKAKDFAKSDAIRSELAALGVAVQDAGDKSDWTIEQ
ncbi:MAG TPA: cysteine--tRNA ligase [Polyangiaceae bacterium]|nr:cysteine--tRNA ligase [Polyangiaceae bacterium]